MTDESAHTLVQYTFITHRSYTAKECEHYSDISQNASAILETALHT